MTSEGIFHDAHEVYAKDDSGEFVWIATFRNKLIAEGYTEWLTRGLGYEFEVRPV